VTRVVIGFGLNLLMPAAASSINAGSGQPVAGLFDSGALPDKDLLARTIGLRLLHATDRLLAEGFEPFRQAWAERDMLISRLITVHDGAGTTEAIALGIDGDGALLVELTGEPGRVRRVLSEEVSVRLHSGGGTSMTLPSVRE
jgi:BirA family biotin operon repressor/biotin-[acetyl-CoA-carboxylase] ligase